jgi:hypothetical protein
MIPVRVAWRDLDRSAPLAGDAVLHAAETLQLQLRHVTFLCLVAQIVSDGIGAARLTGNHFWSPKLSVQQGQPRRLELEMLGCPACART